MGREERPSGPGTSRLGGALRDPQSEPLGGERKRAMSRGLGRLCTPTSGGTAFALRMAGAEGAMGGAEGWSAPGVQGPLQCQGAGEGQCKAGLGSV